MHYFRAHTGMISYACLLGTQVYTETNCTGFAFLFRQVLGVEAARSLIINEVCNPLSV